MKTFIQSLRMIRSYRLYSIVNIVGLGLGLACAIIIAKYVYHELTIDGFHHNNRAVVALTVSSANESSAPSMVGYTSLRGPARDINPLDQPEMAASTQIYTLEDQKIKVGDRSQRMDVIAGDSAFHKVFDFPLAVGDMATVLSDKGNVILTPEAAHRLFGDDDPLGRQIDIDGNPLTVAGITAAVVGKSSIKFDVIVSALLHKEWMSMPMTFGRLHSPAMLDSLNSRLAQTTVKMWGDDPVRYQFMPTTDLYFSDVSTFSPTIFLRGNRGSITVLSIVAVAVLLIGLFNFVNIYTVTLLRRSKELGLKKVFGVTPAEMLWQLVVENFVMVAASTLLALLLVSLTAPLVQGQLGIPVVDNYRFDMPLIVAIMLVVPALTSVYPYLKYRYRSPINSLRAINKKGGTSYSRSVFVVVQYVATIVLIIVSLFFVRQLDFMLEADRGYSPANVIVAQVMTPPEYNATGGMSNEQLRDYHIDRDRKTALAADLLARNPLFLSYSTGQTPIDICARSFRSEMRNPSDSADGWVKVLNSSICPEFLDVYNIRQTEGERLADSIYGLTWNADGSRTADNMGVVINRKAARLMGLKLGDIVEGRKAYTRFWTGKGMGEDSRHYRVVGIIDDFMAGHLSGETIPMVLFSTGNNFNSSASIYTSIRFPEGRTAETIGALKEIFDQVNPGGEFKYEMASDQMAAVYSEDRKVARIYSTFALVAILISSLGLFSLSIYDVQQRTREIAIRKVHGATEGEVIAMLCRKYYILLGVAFLIAAPIAVVAIRSYTADFAVRAPLSWWIFVVAAVATALISLCTLIWQTSRAARTNPSEAVRSNS